MGTYTIVKQIYPGLGVEAPKNLTYIPYLKSIGVQSIRIGGVQPVPWNPSWNFDARKAAAHYKKEGFWVQYDITDAVTQNGFGHPITASNWAYFHDTAVAEAAYLQSQGLIFDVLGLGNELENFIDNTTMTYAGLYSKLQQLALDVRAVYSGKLTYNFFNQPLTSYQGWDPAQGWRLGGRGNFDYIAIHPYATITAPVVPMTGILSAGSRWVADSPLPSNTYTLNFNGSNSRVDLGRPAGLTNLSSFTLAGWVRVDVPGKQTFWSNCFNWSLNFGQGIYFSTINSAPGITIQQGRNAVSSGYPSYKVGDWFYLIVEQNGDVVSAWIDDTKIIDAKPLQRASQYINNSFFGVESGNGFPFNGGGFNIGIWNRILTSAEKSGLKSSPYPAAGLVGTYLVPTGSITPATVDFTKINVEINSWFYGFGDRFYISEFNIESVGLNILGATDDQRRQWMQTMLDIVRTATVNANGLKRMFFYKLTTDSFSASGPDSIGFGMLHPDGSQSPSADVLMS